jgi:hypothetical protein
LSRLHPFDPETSLEARVADTLAASPDGRRMPRKPMCMPALLGIPGYRLQIPCRVLDMSGSGFGTVLVIDPKRRIRTTHDLPDRLTLIMVHERTEIDCEVRWRAGERFGARFTSRTRPHVERPL